MNKSHFKMTTMPVPGASVTSEHFAGGQGRPPLPLSFIYFASCFLLLVCCPALQDFLPTSYQLPATYYLLSNLPTVSQPLQAALYGRGIAA